MKAWIVNNKNDVGSVVIYAETRGKAIAKALCADGFEDCMWTDLYARRFKEFDKYYKEGQDEADWDDPEIRTTLVKDYGWGCYDISHECETCKARQYCRWEAQE